MARIRSIFPGLFTDEEFMALTVSAPLAVPLLLGLWTVADDQGVFEWKPLTIKARILPAVAVDVEVLLNELVARRFITFFEVGGRPYGAIRNFRKWQRPKKPNAVHPLPEGVRAYVGLDADESPTGGEPVPNQSGKVSAEGGGRREEVGGTPSLPSVEREARAPSRSGTLSLPGEQPYPGHDLDAAQAGLAGDLGPVWAAFVEHHHAEGKLIHSIPHAWRKWCRREIGFRQREGPNGPKRRGPDIDDMLNRI